MEGDGLGVIAGAGGDDAAAALIVGEGEDFVQRAALFEGSGALQVVELEKTCWPVISESSAEWGAGDR
jgi:hypothetical protein